jgi:hypothetical protein
MILNLPFRLIIETLHSYLLPLLGVQIEEGNNKDVMNYIQGTVTVVIFCVLVCINAAQQTWIDQQYQSIIQIKSYGTHDNTDSAMPMK